MIDAVEDAKAYLIDRAREMQRKQQQQNQHQNEVQLPEQLQLYADDSEILTIHDAKNKQMGLPPQHYDAFMVYSEDNIEFATEVLDVLEKQGFNVSTKYQSIKNFFLLVRWCIVMCSPSFWNFFLQIFVKSRDLIAGGFEQKLIKRMIEERCERLLLVISEGFFKCAENEFYMDYAEAMGIQNRQRKILPVIYGNCDLPSRLRFLSVLRYRQSKLYNFWDKLAESLRTVPQVTPPPSAVTTPVNSQFGEMPK